MVEEHGARPRETQYTFFFKILAVRWNLRTRVISSLIHHVTMHLQVRRSHAQPREKLNVCHSNVVP